MKNLKAVTAATMSSILSLFGCDNYSTEIIFKDEFVKIKDMESKPIGKDNRIYLTMAFYKKADSIMRIGLATEDSIIVGKMEKEKSYSITGEVIDYAGQPLLRIFSLKEQKPEERISELATQIQQIQSIEKAAKENFEKSGSIKK